MLHFFGLVDSPAVASDFVPESEELVSELALAVFLDEPEELDDEP